MKDEKGRFSKNPSDDYRDVAVVDARENRGNFVFNATSPYYLGFISFLLYGLYYLWTHVLYIFYPKKCQLACSECDLNACYDYVNCLCRACIECLHQLGFILYM